MWLHKARTTLVIAAITIGVAGAGAVLDTWSLIRRVTADEFAASNPASATLRMDGVDTALLRAVRALPEISAAAGHRTVSGSVRTSAGIRTVVFFVTDDYAGSRIGALVPQAGQWPPRDGDMIIERSSVDFAGIGVGDDVLARARDGQEATLRVSGIVHDVAVAPGWMEHVVYGFITPGTLEHLGLSATLNELRIVVRDNAMDRDAVRRVAFRAKAVAERLGHRVTDVDVPEPGAHVHAAQINSLLLTQGAFGVLAMFMSALLVVNLITAMLAGQVREIGTMKAIGASAGQIIVVYLSVAFALGAVATAIAVPLAAVVGRQYATFTADLLNFSVNGVPIPRGAIAAQIAVGLLLPILSAAMPVVLACRVSVSDALRDIGLGGGAGRVVLDVPRWARAEWLPRTMRYAVRNVLRRRQRAVLTVFTLATGGAVYLGAGNLGRSVKGSVDRIYDTQHFQMTLRVAQPALPEALERVVRATPGVSAAESWSGARAAVVRADGSPGSSFAVSAPPVETRLVRPGMTAGRWLKPGDQRVLVVSRRLMEMEPSMTLGRDVALIINGKTQRWVIIGKYDSGIDAGAYAPRETMLSETGVPGATAVLVVSADTSAQAIFMLVQRVRDALRLAGMPVQSSTIVSEARSSIEDHLFMVVSFLGVMGQLMIVVGGLGLAATMSISVLERTREIGVLRALGARHSSIHALVHGEGLMIALASWLVAVPISVPMSIVLGQAFGRVMFPVPVMLTPEPTGVMRWFAVVVIITVAACAIPAWRATQIAPRVALAFE